VAFLNIKMSQKSKFWKVTDFGSKNKQQIFSYFSPSGGGGSPFQRGGHIILTSSRKEVT